MCPGLVRPLLRRRRAPHTRFSLHYLTRRVGKIYLFLVCVDFGAFLGGACDLVRFNVWYGLLWVGECVAAILRVNM